jgi:hypothetical protein
MTVYLGNQGGIELKRASGQPVKITLLDGDVSVEKRRFSPEEELLGTFISGDQVDIETVDGSELHLIDGHAFNDWRGFIYVDPLGSLRLYDSFEDAVSGQLNTALPLIAWPDRQDLLITTRGDTFTPLAKITSYDFTTERETVNTTHLGSQFVQQYEAGLIAGQGSIDCFWEHKSELCDPDACSNGVEFSAYLAQLCIRLTQGADFFGRFFVFRDSDPGVNSVWYEAECIVTSASISVEVGEIITSTIQFVTTGEFKLLYGVPPSYLAQEDGISLILQEDGESRLILAE